MTTMTTMTKQDFAEQLSDLLYSQLQEFIEALHEQAEDMLAEFDPTADYSSIEELVRSTYVNGEAPSEEDIVSALEGN